MNFHLRICSYEINIVIDYYFEASTIVLKVFHLIILAHYVWKKKYEKEAKSLISSEHIFILGFSFVNISIFPCLKWFFFYWTWMDCIISFFYSFGTRFFIFLIDSIFNVIQSYDFEIPSIPSNVAVKSKIQTCGQIVQVPKNEEIESKNSLDFQVEGVVLGMVFRPDSVQGPGFRFWPGRSGQNFF